MKRITVLLIVLIITLSVFPVNAATFKSIRKNPDFFYGVDVSVWNDDLNWNTLRDNGVEFAYIRVGCYDKSGGYLDKRFVSNVKKCVESGVEFGVYVYSYVYTKEDNVKCAQWVHNQIKKLGAYTRDRGTIQVAYDIEDKVQLNAMKYKVSTSYMQQSVVKFCDKVKSYGYVPVVYSSESWFNDYLSIDKLREKGIRIWYAQWPYQSNLDTTVKKVMINKTIADVWQFSSSFTINGTVFDTNVTYDDFIDYSKETSSITVKGLKKSYSNSSKAVKPTFSVYDGNNLLIKGTDYKLVYFRNNRPGRAKIKIIRYKDSKYYETKTVFFGIKPKKVSNLKLSASSESISMKWDPVKGASEYRIYQLDTNTNTFDLIDTVKSNSYNNYFLDEGTLYTLRVRAVIKSGKIKYVGKYAEASAYTTYKKISIISAETTENDTVLVKWKPKKSNCEGYRIYYSDTQDFADYEKAEIADPSASEIRLKLDDDSTARFVRIRSYKTVDGKRIYSNYSKILEIK